MESLHGLTALGDIPYEAIKQAGKLREVLLACLLVSKSAVGKTAMDNLATTHIAEWYHHHHPCRF